MNRIIITANNRKLHENHYEHKWWNTTAAFCVDGTHTLTILLIKVFFYNSNLKKVLMHLNRQFGTYFKMWSVSKCVMKLLNYY